MQGFEEKKTKKGTNKAFIPFFDVKKSVSDLHVLQEMGEAASPHGPVVPFGEDDPFVGMVCLVQSAPEPFAVGVEEIPFAHVQAVLLVGIGGHFHIVQHGREKRHGADAVGA